MSKQLTKAEKARAIRPALQIPAPKLNLLSINSDAKTSKGAAAGTYTAVLYLAPAEEADANNLNRHGRRFRNICAWASPGCRDGCLYRSGRAEHLPSIPAARIRKTLMMFDQPELFFAMLKADLAMLAAWQEATGAEVAVRLDGTSDRHLAKRFARLFPNLIFYDYTKSIKHLLRNTIPNLHLTFSRSELNESKCLEALAHGFSVAVVWRSAKQIPQTFWGFPVVNGDRDDRRFADRETFNLDPDQPFIVALTAKGSRAKADTTGFVLD
jgi:hypothetical protein